MTNAEIRIPALEIKQNEKRTLYTFAIDGKQIHSFATVSRLRRESGVQLNGYQRPEVLSHIAEIRSYLESEAPMIPNAVVVAFDARVRFEPNLQAHSGLPYSRFGTLVIPLDSSLPDEKKPGFIVDGQQRLAAVREADIDSFPICVTAFITSDVRQQMEQFILVNSTKPLPKGLIYELLPSTTTALPSLLQKRRLPAYILTRMNHDLGSPLFEKIQTTTNPTGPIKDNSFLKMLEQSLSDGVLYRFKGTQEGADNVDGMLGVLKPFWSAVSKTFRESWGLPPRRSRLLHGAGVVGLGLLMDAITEKYRQTGTLTEEQFASDLEAIKDVCRWNDGYWDFGPGCQRKWNEIQNTPKDISLLANYLLVQYKSLVWNKESKTPTSIPKPQEQLALIRN